MANRVLTPDLFIPDSLVHIKPEKATELTVELCPIIHAVYLVREWHSRLPNVQKAPWMYAFRAHFNGVTYAVALWNNPSARTLPQQWMELRRLAVSSDAPHCTASRMLGQMAKWFKKHRRECSRLISYQDIEVHTGTIYAAAGWKRAYFSKPRVRERVGYVRPGTNRQYRSSINGAAPDVAGKWRWELSVES